MVDVHVGYCLNILIQIYYVSARQINCFSIGIMGTL